MLVLTAPADEQLTDELARLATEGLTVLSPREDPAQTLAEIRAVLDPAISGASESILAVRRRLADADLIVLLNVGSTDVCGPVAPSVRHTTWELWDARTGQVTALVDPGSHEIRVAAHGAAVLVGHDGAAPTVPAPPLAPPQGDATAGGLVPSTWRSPAGDPVSFPVLADWRAGAGGVRITTEVDVDEPVDLVLDLGTGGPTYAIAPPDRATGPSYRARYLRPVGTAVVVSVDGERLASLWAPPYRVPVHLGPGPHRIEIEALGTLVGSVVGNELLLERQRALASEYGHRFAFQDVHRDPEPVTVGFRVAPRLRLATATD